MNFEIKSRRTGKVIFSAEIESPASAPYAIKLGLSVRKAVEAGASLTGADLTGADLTGADLTGTNLTGACFVHADLTGTNLTGADLTDADLAGADLTGANLARANGQPMVKESFGNWFRKACNEAGVRGSAHGVRKLAATIMAEKGATNEELKAAFGWQTNEQSTTYTRSADRRRLAIQGARRLMAGTDEG